MEAIPMSMQSIRSWLLAPPWWALAAVAILPALALSLAAQQSDSLVVSGQSGSAKVIQVGGHNYVEVESLARLTNSSIRFNGNQIVLSLPGTAEAAAPAAPASTPGFSKEFVTAGIEAMARVREWHAALRNAIERGYPLAEDWLAAYNAQALQGVRLANVAVNTAADKNALPFLTNEFNNMGKLSDKYVQMTKSMNYIAPDSLVSDPLDQKIRSCAHALASMATTNQFVDDGSCQ
jgi:hypothetical protein